MRISTVKEIKTDEHRVGLTPNGAATLVADGHQVLIEGGAGTGSGFRDEDYVRSGAAIVTTDQAWANTDLVVKVKEPVPGEYHHLREDVALFTYLHLAADRPLTEALLSAGTTGVAYETVTDSSGGLPLLTPMSEVAGRLAPQMAAQMLERRSGGAGLLMGGIPGVLPARVLVLGGGVVGYNAAVVAAGMGADVTVVDASLSRIRYLDHVFGTSVSLAFAEPALVSQLVAAADVVIGAVLIPGARAPRLVTAAQLTGMRDGSVLVDVAIDQGGCFETSHATTHSDPSYVVEGVVHYCVANMPGAVPRTSTIGLTNATLPHVRALAGRGVLEALLADEHLAGGLTTFRGRLIHPAVATALGLPSTTTVDALNGQVRVRAGLLPEEN